MNIIDTLAIKSCIYKVTIPNTLPDGLYEKKKICSKVAINVNLAGPVLSFVTKLFLVYLATQFGLGNVLYRFPNATFKSVLKQKLCTRKMISFQQRGNAPQIHQHRPSQMCTYTYEYRLFLCPVFTL
jgi:hypothetical protein